MTPAVFWYQILRTGYVRPAVPIRILVPVLTDRLRPGRATVGPPDPAVFWYRFLQTVYGWPARPGRILVPVLTGRVGSQTGALVTYVNCFDPSSYPDNELVQASPASTDKCTTANHGFGGFAGTHTLLQRPATLTQQTQQMQQTQQPIPIIWVPNPVSPMAPQFSPQLHHRLQLQAKPQQIPRQAIPQFPEVPQNQGMQQIPTQPLPQFPKRPIFSQRSKLRQATQQIAPLAPTPLEQAPQKQPTQQITPQEPENLPSQPPTRSEQATQSQTAQQVPQPPPQSLHPQQIAVSFTTKTSSASSSELPNATSSSTPVQYQVPSPHVPQPLQPIFTPHPQSPQQLPHHSQSTTQSHGQPFYMSTQYGSITAIPNPSYHGAIYGTAPPTPYNPCRTRKSNITPAQEINEFIPGQAYESSTFLEALTSKSLPQDLPDIVTCPKNNKESILQLLSNQCLHLDVLSPSKLYLIRIQRDTLRNQRSVILPEDNGTTDGTKSKVSKKRKTK
ncbi:hypothetical protein BC829DRAFT_418627 [Chytridium lagenaria]|nr:hypothetical protein BC829DRAFT_418627 [Chytridium lagenaria]